MLVSRVQLPPLCLCLALSAASVKENSRALTWRGQWSHGSPANTTTAVSCLGQGSVLHHPWAEEAEIHPSALGALGHLRCSFWAKPTLSTGLAKNITLINPQQRCTRPL